MCFARHLQRGNRLVNDQYMPQKRYQGSLQWVRVLYVCAGELLNSTKTQLICSVSYFNSGDLEFCLGGLSPPTGPALGGWDPLNLDVGDPPKQSSSA